MTDFLTTLLGRTTHGAPELVRRPTSVFEEAPWAGPHDGLTGGRGWNDRHDDVLEEPSGRDER